MLQPYLLQMMVRMLETLPNPRTKSHQSHQCLPILEIQKRTVIKPHRGTRRPIYRFPSSSRISWPHAAICDTPKGYHLLLPSPSAHTNPMTPVFSEPKKYCDFADFIFSKPSKHGDHRTDLVLTMKCITENMVGHGLS